MNTLRHTHFHRCTSLLTFTVVSLLSQRMGTTLQKTEMNQ